MTPDTSLSPVTAEIAKAKLSLALTNAQISIQSLQTKADTLVYNEDNLVEIKETLTGLEKIVKTIEEAHKTGKAPAWAECTAWDVAKRDLSRLVTPILAQVSTQYTKLCQAVESRKRAEKLAEEKKKGISDAIIAKILGFSQEITTAKTNKELLAVESRINLEKTRTQTYGDQLPDLIERCSGLNELLKTQKVAVKELEVLEKATETALATGDDEKLMELEEKKEQVTEKIQEIKVKTEERAINSSTQYNGGGGYREAYPAVKAKRTTVDWEVLDMALFYKKHPEMTTIMPNKKVDEYVVTRKAEITDTNPEIVFDGLRIFQKKTY